MSGNLSLEQSQGITGQLLVSESLHLSNLIAGPVTSFVEDATGMEELTH